MYLRSNASRRHYRRRGRHIALWRVLFWLIAPALIALGVVAYQNRDVLRPVVGEVVAELVGDAEAALATAQAPPPTPTPDPTNNLRLAEQAWERGSVQEAVRYYRLSVDALPNDLRTHYYLTYGLVMMGRYDEAVAAGENTVTANPFAADAWAIRALALNRAERYGESLASALHALELDPESARARAFLAETYADLGYVTRAETEVARALDADPDSVEARYVSAMLDWEANFDFESAREGLQQAYEDSGLTIIGVDLALLNFAWFEDYEAGEAILNEMLERNPENTAVLYQMGRYQWRTRGDREQGITYLTRCVAADPQNIPCTYELARAQADVERTDEARRNFEQVIALGSDDPYHFWWAGNIQIAALGDCSAAMQYFEPGYAIALNAQANGSSRYGEEAINALVQNYQDAMAPCQAFNPVPVPDNTPTPDPESGEDGAGDTGGDA